MKFRSILSALSASLAVAVALLGGGCATYKVKVDAISRSPSPTGKLVSYQIRNSNPAVEADSLRYKEVAERLKTALSGRGLWEAPNAEAADMIIDLDYNVERSRVIYEKFSTPVFNPIDGEVICFNEKAMPVLVYEKRLSVVCRENKPAVEGRPPNELWRISVSVEDRTKDLREAMPVLASTVMDQIGRTTNGVVTSNVSKNDPAIDFVKNGL